MLSIKSIQLLSFRGAPVQIPVIPGSVRPLFLSFRGASGLPFCHSEERQRRGILFVEDFSLPLEMTGGRLPLEMTGGRLPPEMTGGGAAARNDTGFDWCIYTQ